VGWRRRRGAEKHGGILCSKEEGVGGGLGDQE